jgi:hypothetical protein
MSVIFRLGLKAAQLKESKITGRQTRPASDFTQIWNGCEGIPVYRIYLNNSTVPIKSVATPKTGLTNVRRGAR